LDQDAHAIDTVVLSFEEGVHGFGAGAHSFAEELHGFEVVVRSFGEEVVKEQPHGLVEDHFRNLLAEEVNGIQ
jgi:hypothetical protein